MVEEVGEGMGIADGCLFLGPLWAAAIARRGRPEGRCEGEL